jgi:hypothetical protein
MTADIEFDVPESVLDRLDEIADVIADLEPNWRDQPPNALIAAVARLDETLAEHCEGLGFKGDMSETMAQLIYEMYRRQDQPRYKAARIAHEVMEAGRQYVAQMTAPFN